MRSLDAHSWPPLYRGPAAAIDVLTREIEEMQWLAPAAITEGQYRQLPVLAAWCAEHSPLFARNLHEAGLTAGDLATSEAFMRLPLLRRRALQIGGNSDTYCRKVPDDHGTPNEIRSSGSTGEPACVRRTAISQLFWFAHTMREYLWHGDDFAGRAAIVRASVHEYSQIANWGAPAALLRSTGPAALLPLRADVKQQLAWVSSFGANTLLVYPSILAAMTREAKQGGLSFPDLHLIRTISETLSTEVRTEAEAVFGVKVLDNYSSQEAGIVAIECPVSRLYHVMSDSLIVEVLRDDGAACGDGEIGRVVLTDLHNFATPLIRYALGDYAEAGPSCPCGRGLPTLRRILGRERNLVRLPDGTAHWPHFGIMHFWEHAPVHQFQFIQHDLEHIEARLAVDTKPSAEAEAGLRKLILDELGYPFDLEFVYFETALPRSASGKHEEFVCKVDATSASNRSAPPV